MRFEGTARGSLFTGLCTKSKVRTVPVCYNGFAVVPKIAVEDNRESARRLKLAGWCDQDAVGLSFQASGMVT